VPYSATGGRFHPPQEAARPPREPGRALHGTSRSRGVAFRHPRAAICVPVPALAACPCSGCPGSTTTAQELIAAAGGLAFFTAPQRSDRASWTRSRHTRPAFQAPIACHVGCWYRRPVAGRRRQQYAAARSRGDKFAANSFQHGEPRLRRARYFPAPEPWKVPMPRDPQIVWAHRVGLLPLASVTSL